MMRFWFEPTSPLNLGMCRLVWLGTILLMRYAWVDFSAWSDVPAVFWRPTFLFDVLGLGPPDKGAVAVLQVVWRVALILSFVGLFTRTSTLLAFVVGLYLIGVGHNYGKVHHSDAVVVLTLGILACSRCGDAVSIDRLLRRDRIVPSSGEYRWPVRLVWVLLSLILLAAGIAKLRTSGLAWINGENLAILLVQHHYGSGSRPPTNWGLQLAQQHWMCSVISLGTLMIECSFFLALLHPRLRAVLVPSALAMLVAFGLLMGVWFAPLLATFVFWIPWDVLARKLSASRRESRFGQASPRERTENAPVAVVGRSSAEFVRRVGM